MNDATFQDRLFAALQWVLPTRALSLGMYALTRIRWAPFKNAFIRLFMRGFSISLKEAEIDRPEGFATFNAFFTRALKADARPLAPEPAWLSPVDGTLSQFGALEEGRLIQAKGRDYRVDALLTDPLWAHELRDGSFATIYLAPYNYHRIHMPMAGRLRCWCYVPGRLFSVNAATARAMPNLFARNERLVAVFDTDRGPLMMVLVGALFVGGLETVWSGPVTPPHLRNPPGAALKPMAPVALARGAEMGRFNMGSTVILLGGPGVLPCNNDMQLGQAVTMGMALGMFE